MKILGIVAEYNPFHTGHAYQIREAKGRANADYVIVVMSGDFVQRGEPAIFSKRIRAKQALLNGVDLIIELPVRVSTASAEGFATGAVQLLHDLGCVNVLSFGVEEDNLPLLRSIASIMAEEPETYRGSLQNFLRKGLSYPAAREEAVVEYLSLHFGNNRTTESDNGISETMPVTEITGSIDSAYINETSHTFNTEGFVYSPCGIQLHTHRIDSKTLRRILGSPNNILAIEYLRALERLGSSMEVLPILRQGNGYHQEELDTDGEHSSATAIRKAITEGNKDWTNWTPNPVAAMSSYVIPDDLSPFLGYALLQSSYSHSFREYEDISEELANRIENAVESYSGYTDFCQKLHNKSTTYSHISRALIHILLNLRKRDSYRVPYAHILGFRKDAEALLTILKKTSSLPLITAPARAKAVLNEDACALLREDIHASQLYRLISAQKTGNVLGHELREPVIVV